MSDTKLEIEASPRVIKILEAMVKTELYGHTKEEVAEELVRRGIEKILMDGTYEKLMVE